MCKNQFPASADWSYYLVERIIDDVNAEVHYVWRFEDRTEAFQKLYDEISKHPDRAYQIYKSID